MKDDGLGDWRFLAASRLAKAAGVHPVGTPVHSFMGLGIGKGKKLGFITPSPSAMFLDLAKEQLSYALKVRPNLKKITECDRGWGN